MPGQFLPPAQDSRAASPPRSDHLNGFVVRKGDALGVPRRPTGCSLALVKLLEERGSPRE